MSKWIIFFLTLLFFSINVFAKIDDSVSIFFPKEAKILEASQTEFSYFWWNFIVIDPAAEEQKPNFEIAKNICSKLVGEYRNKIQQIYCGDYFEFGSNLLQEWSLSLPLRSELIDSSEQRILLRKKMNQTISQIGMISDPKLMQILRADPFQSWQAYLDLLKDKTSQNFSLNQGFMFDTETRRIIIPVQFSVPPKKANIADVAEYLNAVPEVSFIGAHASSYLNEYQISKDLEIVSIFTSIFLVLFALFLISKKRKNVIFLYIPVLVSVSAAACLTELAFGSIHGLTLAFGSGIIGLVLDYGLHGAFNVHSAQTWKSNTIGVLTTMIGLIGLIFSSIPLIKQIMLFSVLGLSIGYFLFYVLCKKLTKYFSMDGLNYKIPENKYLVYFSFLLTVVSFLSFSKINWSLDLKSLNFQTPKSEKIADWFFTKSHMGEPILKVYKNSELQLSETHDARLKSEKINSETLFSYMPNFKTQEKNLISWKNALCVNDFLKLSQVEKKLFDPFWKNLCSDKIKAISVEDLKQSDFLKHLGGESEFLAVYYAKNKDEKNKILNEVDGSKSMVDLVLEFPTSLEKDLKWIIPIAFLFTIFSLMLYYRSLKFTIAALWPFLNGLGVYLGFIVVTNNKIDLMSLIGLIMVFCFSLDYGIFATDIVAFPQSKNNELEVKSSLTFAAISNLIGYLPMVLAHHVVLHQLGTSLFLGTLGTYVGTMWGSVPFANLKWGLITKKIASHKNLFLSFLILFLLSACQTSLPSFQKKSDFIFPDGIYQQRIEVEFQLKDSQEKQRFEFSAIFKKKGGEKNLVAYNTLGITLLKIKETPDKKIEFISAIDEINLKKDKFLQFYPSVSALIDLKEKQIDEVKNLELKVKGKVKLHRGSLNEIPGQVEIKADRYLVRIKNINYTALVGE